LPAVSRVRIWPLYLNSSQPLGGEVILMSWKSRQRIPIFLICEVFVYSLFPGCSNKRFFIRGWFEIDLQCPGMLLCIIFDQSTNRIFYRCFFN
jgi:hypothetical protein